MVNLVGFVLFAVGILGVVLSRNNLINIF